MALKVFVYDLAVKVAVIAENEEEAQARMDQGQGSQISIERTLASTTDIAVD
jgi:hypothetical protein